MSKIIIIEDTETIREELRIFLTKYGYKVIAPTNFENIIEYTLGEEPDLILLDINLPVFDGYYICREIRKISEVPRVQGVNTQDTLTYNDLKFNLSNGSIVYKGISAELTKNEIKILSCMIKNKGKIVSRDDLMDFMWNSDSFVDDNNLSVNVTRLRKKLEEVGMKENIEIWKVTIENI
ncbi:MAG TPA: response regulator transcription factor [Epulopiscium sp.]|nr:response regulator transcription factor [Candidatus Epulonipiscium sp.]